MSTKLSASAFSAEASMRRAPSRATSVSGSLIAAGWRIWMIVLSSSMAYRSSGGSGRLQHPPRYAAFSAHITHFQA